MRLIDIQLIKKLINNNYSINQGGCGDDQTHA